MLRPVAALALVLPALVFGAEKAARAPEAVSPPAASSSSGYELRGFFGTGDKLQVSLREPGAAGSKWRVVGKKSGDVLVESADPKAGTAVVLVGGRRLTLKLAAPSNATTFVAPAVSKEPSPEEAKAAKEAARKKRRERFEAMHANATPEQMEAFGKVMQERMEVLRKEKPDLFTPEAWGDEGRVRQSHELMIPVMKEAAEAAAKLPGKDGKIAPVDPDFEPMMRAELADNLERMREARATPAPVEVPAVKQ